MKRQRQLISHAPPERYGDCFRTSVACVLGLPAALVPHVCHDGADGDKAFNRMREYLAMWGMDLVAFAFNGAHFTLEDVLEGQARTNPGKPYLLSGESVPGVNHTVVCIDDRIYCDPMMCREPLIGPVRNEKEGDFWYLEFFAVRLP